MSFLPSIDNNNLRDHFKLVLEGFPPLVEINLVHISSFKIQINTRRTKVWIFFSIDWTFIVLLKISKKYFLTCKLILKVLCRINIKNLSIDWNKYSISISSEKDTLTDWLTDLYRWYSRTEKSVGSLSLVVASLLRGRHSVSPAGRGWSGSRWNFRTLHQVCSL